MLIKVSAIEIRGRLRFDVQYVLAYIAYRLKQQKYGVERVL
jgi:hypothetical protein